MSPHRSDHLIKHSLLLLTASLATNVITLLTHVFMGRMLSQVEYGALVSMLGLLMMVGTPLNALSNALSFYSAKLIEEGREGAIRPFMWRWFGRMLIVAIVITALGIAFSPAISSFFKMQRLATFLTTIVVLGILLFLPVVGGILQGVQAFGWAAVSSIGAGCIRIICSVAFVYFGGRLADWAVAGHGMGVLTGLLIGAVGISWIFRGREAAAADKNVTAYFLNSLIVLAGFSVMMSADVLIVKHYFSPEESGLFAQVSTIGKIAIFLPMPIAGALFPKIVAAGESGGRHVRLLFRGILLAGSMIAAIVAAGLLIPQAPLWIMYGIVHPSETMLSLVRYMFIAMSPLSLAYIVMNYHMAQNRFGILFLLPLCALLYLAGAAVWHASVFQIIAVMAVSNLAALAVLLAGLKRFQAR